jgi:formiminotetrahydrofolate cyclodeaminase
VQTATKAAIAVRLRIMAVCQQILYAAISVATYAPVRARGEVAVGVELVRASFHGAGVCVAASLPAITDADFVAHVTDERRQLESDAADARETIRLALADSAACAEPSRDSRRIH